MNGNEDRPRYNMFRLQFGKTLFDPLLALICGLLSRFSPNSGENPPFLRYDGFP